jgi:hypothetical protein
MKDLEEVGEVGIVAAALGLKVCEVLELRSDHQKVIHHFGASNSSSLWIVL